MKKLTFLRKKIGRFVPNKARASKRVEPKVSLIGPLLRVYLNIVPVKELKYFLTYVHETNRRVDALLKVYNKSVLENPDRREELFKKVEKDYDVAMRITK